LILIGNKNDLEDQRQVTKEMGEEKAKELGLAFMETSACSGENLDKAFQLMINEIYKKSKEDIMGEGEENIVQQGKDITLDKTKGKPAKKKCC
jgi:GTPase SAR1 family protein